MKSMKDLKFKKNKNHPPLPFMVFMPFMVRFLYSFSSNPEPLNGERGTPESLSSPSLIFSARPLLASVGIP